MAQAQLNTQSDIDYAVIDNLRRYSWVMDQMVFDDSVTPGVGGGTLTYGYTRLKAARTAGFRAFNAEYTPAHAEKERLSVELKPLGGSFEIDRVLAKMGPSATNEVSFQLQQLLVSTRVTFQQELILGDTAVNALGFDGLDKILTGKSTEYVPTGTGYTDWSMATVTSQSVAQQRLDMLDEWLSAIVPSTTGGGDLGSDGALPPGVKAIIGNTQSITRVKALARWAAAYTESKDDLGRMIQRYGDWVLIDAGDRADGSAPIIPIESRDPDGAGAGTTVTGLTDLFAISFGLDSFHGAAMAGTPLLETWMPDYQRAGAVKRGEVEMGPVACVLRNTKACGVLRNVKVR